MATHDYDIANQSGAAFRTDLNNALAAVQSNNSNSSSPATTVAYQWWADTSAGVMKIRNAANNAWIELFELDGTLTIEDGSKTACGLQFRGDANTGIFSSANDKFNIAAGGVERLELGGTTIFNEDGEDVDFRIEGSSDANLFYVDSGNHRIGIGTSTPASKLDIQGDGITITSTAPFISFVDSDNDDDFNIQVSGGFFSINSTTDSASRLQIGSTGLVTIGTTTPHSGAMLTVASKALCITGQNNAHIANGLVLGEEGSGLAQIRCYGPDNSTFGKLTVQLSAADGSGNLGDVTFERESNGANIKLPANGGISFAASGGTGASNASTSSQILDDYELGLWTPVVHQGVDGGAGYSIQRGWYCRIGGCLQYSFFLRLINDSTGSTGNGNQLAIAGLPYAAVNLSPHYSSGGFVTYTNMSGSGSSQIALYQDGNSTVLYCYRDRSSAFALSGAQQNKEMYGIGQYRVA